MSEKTIPLPEHDPMTDEGKLITGTWSQFLNKVLQDLLSAPKVIASLVFTAQTAAISATALATPANPGLYRVSYNTHVTTAAGVSSSVTVTVAWTQSGSAVSDSSAALTANATNVARTGSLLLQLDGGTAVNVSTSYASNAAGAMAYELYVTLEKVQI